MAQGKNIIHAIDIFLQELEFGTNPLMTVYHEIISCHKVKKANLSFTVGDLKMYWGWLKEGLLYAQKRWGEECIPGILIIATSDDNYNYMAYDREENSLNITPLHIVYYCSNAFGALMSSDYFPSFGISARNMVILFAVEMCYYAHLAKGEVRNITAFAQSVFGKKQLSEIILRAIKDLNIHLYKIAPEQFDT